MRETSFPAAGDSPGLVPGALGSPTPPIAPYQEAFEFAPDARLLISQTGDVIDANRMCPILLGETDKSAIVGRRLASVLPPMDVSGSDEDEIKTMIAVACQGSAYSVNWQVRSEKGTAAPLSVSLRSLGTGENHGTEPAHLQATLRRKNTNPLGEPLKLEDALEDAARGVSSSTGEAFFRSLVEYLSKALRADYAFIGELTGPDQDSIRTIAVCADGQIAPNIEYDLLNTPCANVTSAITGCEVCVYTTGVQAAFPKDDLLIQMGVDAYVGTSLQDSEGAVVGLLVVMYKYPILSTSVARSMLQVFAARAAAELERQRTERARESTVQALTESEERFKSAFERSAIGMAIIGMDDRFIQANPALCKLLGYSLGELCNLTTASISHQGDLARLRSTRKNSQKLLAGEINSFQVEKRYRRKDGSYFWALVGVSPVRDLSGELTHFITQVQDISERKRAEEERTKAIDELRRANEELEVRVQERTAELERDRALLEAVLQQMPAGVMVAEAPSGRLLLGNRQMTRILSGGAADDAPLGSVADLNALTLRRASGGSAYAPGELPIARTLQSGEIVQEEEATLLRSDGSRGVLLFSSRPVHNDQGQIIAAVGTGQDITDRKNTEEALRQLHNELEMQVQERTAELADTNTALQIEVEERRRAEQVSRGQTEALALTINALTAQSDLDTFLSYLMVAIRDVFHADSLGLELYDSLRDVTVPRNSYSGDVHLTPDLLREMGVAPFMPAKKDVAWQAVLANPRPFAVYDMKHDPRVMYRQLFLNFGIQSTLIVPLLLGEKPMGYLFLSHKEARRYGREEIELAQTLAQQVVLAVQLETLASKGEEAAVLSERNRLAREIHDTLAQGFAGILIHLQLAEAALTRKPDKALPALLQARDLAKSSLAEARRSVLALRPTALDNANLSEAVRKITDQVTAGTRLRCRMEVLGAPCPLPKETEDHLVRIAQEALGNTVKYARATEASVALTFGDGTVCLDIADNGAGFVLGSAPRGGGFGLIGMRERLDALHGHLSITSAPGEGTQIHAVVPIACHTDKTL